MFSPKTLEFIAENHWMSNKEWFAAHKEDYRRYVREPLIGLSNVLADVVEGIDSELVTDPKSSVSRIYRDMRFAKGGSLYRDSLWISFRRDRQAYPCWPEFYFVMGPREFFYGCGYYSAKAEAMDELRKLIIANDKKFVAARTALEAQNEFVLEGDMYKRSRFSEYPEELRFWLDRKTPCFTCRPKLSELFSDSLAERVAKTFAEMKPVYELLVYAESEAVKNKE